MASVVMEEIGVEFPIYGAHRSFRKAVFERATGGAIFRRQGAWQKKIIINALQGVSLTLHEGDRVGLVGHNGAGKSTLLRVLAGIYPPTRGQILVEGRITPLFDALPGLDMEDTGYQNIVTAGLLLGLSRDEIENRIADVEEFSELGEYLSLPVRTYSAGMITRLGFAVAMTIEPDILLMDELIATGDARFKARASDRMEHFIGRSKILVLASHLETLLLSSCNKGALMVEGRLIAFGPIEEIVERYRTGN